MNVSVSTPYCGIMSIGMRNPFCSSTPAASAFPAITPLSILASNFSNQQKGGGYRR